MLSKTTQMWPSSATTPESARDRRSEPRRHVMWSSSLRIDGIDHDCQVLDITLGGARIRTDETPEIGTPVAVHIPHIALLKGTVSWATDGHIGIQFSQGKPEIEFWLGRWARALGLGQHDTLKF